MFTSLRLPSTSLRLLACALSALAASAAAAVPAAADPVSSATTTTGFAYGTIVTGLAAAPLARNGGFNLMSAYVSWRAVEPTRGKYGFEQQDQWGRTAANDLTNVVTAARASGLKIGLRLDDPPEWAGGAVYRLDPADVEDYVYHVVKYASPTIGYIEVFNEMNMPLEWGTSPVDPAAYARLLAGAYRGAKRADPNVTVVSAAPSQRTGGFGGTMEDVDWLNGLYDAGAATAFDALGMHAYIGNQDPTADPMACTPMCFRDIELYRSVMEQHGDTAKRAVITELGTLEQAPVDLGPYEWMELPPQARADYLVQALHMATTQYSWLMGATVFNLDYASSGLPVTSERGWFSLLDASNKGRPAYFAIKTARDSGYLP